MLESHHDKDIIAAAAKLADAQLYADETAARHQVLCVPCAMAGVQTVAILQRTGSMYCIQLEV